MDEEVLVSIIIPAYNSEATVERAVRSALGQTYGHIEVIVVDDGSEDSTVSKVEAIAGEDERVRLLLKPRGGVSAARNDGIMSAKGEWFMTLDADDYYDAEAVSVLLDAALKTDGDIVMCGIRLVYPDGRKKTFKVAEDYTDEKGDFISNLFGELYDRHLITTHANKIYRTDLIWEHGIYYRELLPVHEDIDFVLRCFKHCENIGVVRGAYLNYTQHGRGESLIGKFSPYGIAGALLVVRDLNTLFEDIYTSNKTIETMNLRLFWHVLAYVGIMYRESGYGDYRKLSELKELAGGEDMRRLIREVSPDGVKTALAKVLLGLKLYGAYHALCKLFYRDRSGAGTAEPGVAISPDVIRELCRIPYIELGIYPGLCEDDPVPGEAEDIGASDGGASSGSAEDSGAADHPRSGEREESGDAGLSGSPDRDAPESEADNASGAEAAIPAGDAGPDISCGEIPDIDISPEIDLSLVVGEESGDTPETAGTETELTAAELSRIRERLKTE